MRQQAERIFEGTPSSGVRIGGYAYNTLSQRTGLEYGACWRTHGDNAYVLHPGRPRGFFGTRLERQQPYVNLARSSALEISLSRRFIYGPGLDEPIVSVSPANARAYQYQDALGSVIALRNASRTPYRKVRLRGLRADRGVRRQHHGLPRYGSALGFGKGPRLDINWVQRRRSCRSCLQIQIAIASTYVFTVSSCLARHLGTKE